MKPIGLVIMIIFASTSIQYVGAFTSIKMPTQMRRMVHATTSRFETHRRRRRNNQGALFTGPEPLIEDAIRLNEIIEPTSDEDGDTVGLDSLSRRKWISSFLLGAAAAGVSFAIPELQYPASADDSASTFTLGRTQGLPWEASPINKRSGVTVFDAEKMGYNVKFITYLSRFLLCFDENCQRWWYTRSSDLPRFGTAEQIDKMRLQQFGAFSASVEVGLQEYRGPNGPKSLMASLLRRYCPDPDSIQQYREQAGLPPLSEAAKDRQEREIKEARRQIALLFGLMEANQPVEEITKLLAAIDDGSIYSVEIIDPGSGYAPGYGTPVVKFAPPEAGDDYETASGRAVLRPNGKILRLDLVNRGFGYSKAPTVTISPPTAAVLGDVNATAATAKAFLFRSGVNKGRVERVQLVDPGSGYTSSDVIRVKLSPPEMALVDGGVAATATAVLELEVGGIQIIDGGSGYAVEKPINVYVEAPPLTARVNMNDPMMARIISPDKPLPATTIPSASMRMKMPNPNDPNSVISMVQREANNDGKGGAGGCIGRACYDRPVVAVAYARAEKDSYATFRSEDDALKAQKVDDALIKRSAASAKLGNPVVSGSSSGSGPPSLPFWGGGPSTSSQLLSLLPAGIGLQYDEELKRYVLAVDEDEMSDNSAWLSMRQGAKPLDPEFGPRGRSPIERDMELGISTYLRFCLSGAVCCSAVHLALTPIDVVKTKLQTDPAKYPGIIYSFKKVLRDGGPSSFFTGWAPTFIGFFVWGGFSYTMTELLRRYLTTAAGPEAGNLEVPIILLASGISALFGSFVICPFEAVRIRSVAQPDFAPRIDGVLTRMVAEEGISSLFSAVPAFMLKEIPFAMAKFTVFDISTAWMYDAFPAAREDLQLSLLVSLLGGTLGGTSAALVSNPADATISEMKKAKSDMGPAEAFQKIFARNGIPALFAGWQLRMLFYALLVSLQFLVYDAVRFALGIGADDLKVYLDVLGGALQQKGGPV